VVVDDADLARRLSPSHVLRQGSFFVVHFPYVATFGSGQRKSNPGVLDDSSGRRLDFSGAGLTLNDVQCEILEPNRHRIVGRAFAWLPIPLPREVECCPVEPRAGLLIFTLEPYCIIHQRQRASTHLIVQSNSSPLSETDSPAYL
jgi:hypothetical protein